MCGCLLPPRSSQLRLPEHQNLRDNRQSPMDHRGFPGWLTNWRLLMTNLLEFLRSIQQMVILYATTGMRPNLKDRILRIWFPRQTATTMLATTSALQLRNMAQQTNYPQDPTTCQHEMGLRQYGAAGHRINICDQCGARWVLHPTDQELIPSMPKAAPNAKHPWASQPAAAFRPRPKPRPPQEADHDRSLHRLAQHHRACSRNGHPQCPSKPCTGALRSHHRRRLRR